MLAAGQEAPQRVHGVTAREPVPPVRTCVCACVFECKRAVVVRLGGAWCVALHLLCLHVAFYLQCDGAASGVLDMGPDASEQRAQGQHAPHPSR